MDGVIGALRVEAGKPGRVRVVLREGGSFTLASALAAGLRLGQALPAVEVERLQQLDRQEQGVQYSLRLLARRPRSEHELRQALGRRGLDGADEQVVIERLQQGGWLGDLAFAQAWVENRRDFRPRSARALRYELKQKGVASPAIEAALQGFDEAGAAEAAARAGARKYAALPEEVFRPRLAGYLSRRGFDYSTIAPLVTQMWSERATQESEVSR